MATNSQRKKKREKKPQKPSATMITKDFFQGKIKANAKQIFPMVVIATMSSGKSTLINALMGEELLPAQNAACTDKRFCILNDDTVQKSNLYLMDRNRNIVLKENCLKEELVKANDDEEIADILIYSCIKGILNTDKSLLIIDTPGPNNSMNSSHESKMKEILQDIKGGLVLCVLDATQPGTTDSKHLLETLYKYRVENPQVKMIFVLNKIDEIDLEKESLEQQISAVRNDLIANGFDLPNIIPLSALAVNIFKKVLHNDELTDYERRKFEWFYELYGADKLSMASYAITEDCGNMFETISVHGKDYKVADIMQAIDNTGFRLLENEIQKAQIKNGKHAMNTIQVK